jgi:hypothetical protein
MSSAGLEGGFFGGGAAAGEGRGCQCALEYGSVICWHQGRTCHCLVCSATVDSRENCTYSISTTLPFRGTGAQVSVLLDETAQSAMIRLG